MKGVNMNTDEIKPQKGDIVQVDPKKYPELAWFYYEVKEAKIKDRGSYEVIEILLELPEMKKGSKKSKKKAKQIKKILKNKIFKDHEIQVALQHPSNTLVD
jgi:signal peptidase I